MKTILEFEVEISKEREGSYFEVPFEMPENVAEMEVQYHYPHYVIEEDEKGNRYSEEKSIIDLALVDKDKNHLGSSGSNRSSITISEFYSSDGYSTTLMDAGEWAIVVGAYKVSSPGIKVCYKLIFTLRERCLIKGDLHTHTNGSDGTFSIEGIKQRAGENDLDFVFITDHNNYIQNNYLRPSKDIVMLPGVEWTHFKGHINMLGAKRAYEGSFYANSLEEMQAKVAEANKNGAIISNNHPYCPDCGFKWGLENVDFDAIEIWNGPVIKPREIAAINWWQEKLCQGEQIVALAGSDFHRNELGRDVGLPTTYLYSYSKAPSDIYQSIRNGNAFLTVAPNDVTVDMQCQEKIIGETVEVSGSAVCKIVFNKLKTGDKICLITDLECEELQVEKSYTEYTCEKIVKNEKFIRVEVHRRLIPSLPTQIVLLSNPIYLRKKELDD